MDSDKFLGTTFCQHIEQAHLNHNLIFFIRKVRSFLLSCERTMKIEVVCSKSLHQSGTHESPAKPNIIPHAKVQPSKATDTDQT